MPHHFILKASTADAITGQRIAYLGYQQASFILILKINNTFMLSIYVIIL